jgi:hypothetical protein
MRRGYPREGDERLSGKPGGKSRGSRRKDGSGEPPRPAKRSRRPSELGRALRSVYDDTLREAVPDEFLNLLGKLR